MPTIDGHQLTITHPEKLMFPKDGILKGELVDYYEHIAGRMVPYLRDRPLHMNRFPDGIGRFAIQQKRVPESFPSWIARTTVDLHKGGTITHAVVNDAATLVYLANYNMVTAHVWLSQTESPEEPDQVMFDLDPADEDFTLVRDTALALKTLLEEMKLVPFVKTTGSRGLHVVVPIEPQQKFEEVHLFADAIAQRLAAANPGRLTTEFLKERREGRLFLDVNRNAYAQTAVAAYSVRARAGAPIAVPIAWAEVERDTLRPDGVTIRTVWDWFKSHDDPWAGMESARRPLPALPESGQPDRSGRRRGVARRDSGTRSSTGG
jgi:bifunctional non-homologous end joining protein LigD